MNGFIDAPTFRDGLRDMMEEIGQHNWSEDGITRLMDRYRDKLIAQANMNPRDEARKILMELGTDKKIQAIKALRDRCAPLGLKEAKDFIFQETPTVIAANIQKLHKDLEEINKQVPWGYRVNPQDLKPVNYSEAPF